MGRKDALLQIARANPRPEEFGPRLDAMLGQNGIGSALNDLVGNEIFRGSHNPYLHIAALATYKTILFGRAGFQVDAQREAVLAQVKREVRETLGEPGNRPCWATSNAAAYYVLTGQRCWNQEEAERMRTDLITLIQPVEPSLPDASNAMDYRLIFNEEPWTPQERDLMVSRAQAAIRGFLDQKRGPLSDPPTFPIAIRAAAIRVLLAQEIRRKTDQAGTFNGIEIVDPPIEPKPSSRFLHLPRLRPRPHP